MSVIYGTVVDVQVDVDVKYAPPKSGSYKGYRLTYRAEDGSIKEHAKAMQSLRFLPSVTAALKELKPGDEFTLVQEKNEKGYLDVKSLTKGKQDASELPMVKTERASGMQRATTSTGGFGRNDPEVQKSIIRQSVLKAAADFTSATTKGATAEQVLENAQKFEDWVNRA